ncbi:sporulation-delaying protein SdpB [Viridibacillus sp. YIM B01967]|uniref:Sporulation-delaying protein SdpB n=1 Tax=Viridibacillus soli TaxID=2798301 RepID=A0ABS1H830_9BACL|nr:sporulation-delaying protein SdpB family protein [Viridibacillus soli]MBK3495577.1 sporulation-delaying protein SdpB [Viridibacillus soli]
MNKLIERIEKFNPWTTMFGYMRSLLILATLLMLVFNDTSTLFSYSQYSLSCDNLFVPTAFCLVDNTTFSFELIRYIMIIILLISLLGFYPKYTGIIHWYICYSIQSSALTIDGGEQIATVLSFLLIPITLLDRRKNHFINQNNDIKFFNKTIVFLFFNLIRIQVCLIYLNAAIARLKNKEWADGTAIYYFFKDPIFGIPDWEQQLFSPFLETNILIIITWSVTMLELFLAANIFTTKKLKMYALILGFLLHIGIMFTIGIWTFGLVMLSALLFYLAPLDFNVIKIKNIMSFRNKRNGIVNI